jgi:hypothetical protein
MSFVVFFTSTTFSADHDGLVPPRLLERREGVLGLLEAVGRQAAVGRVVVAADHVVAVDGEPLEGIHRDEDGARVRVDEVHAEAVLDVVEDRRLL